MKRLEVNPNNEKYYTKDFISGFRCGTKRQLQSDLTVIDKIRAEIDLQEKWLLQAGCNAYNVDTAFDAIKSAVTESEDNE